MALNPSTLQNANGLGMLDEWKRAFGNEPNKWPDPIQKSYADTLALKLGLQGINETRDERRERLQVELDAQERMLNFAQGLGKESVETAYKYKTLADIPKTIAQGFGNIAATNLYGGQVLAAPYNYPRLQPIVYNPRPEIDYFS